MVWCGYYCSIICDRVTDGLFSRIIPDLIGMHRELTRKETPTNWNMIKLNLHYWFCGLLCKRYEHICHYNRWGSSSAYPGLCILNSSGSQIWAWNQEIPGWCAISRGEGVLKRSTHKNMQGRLDKSRSAKVWFWRRRRQLFSNVLK